LLVMSLLPDYVMGQQQAHGLVMSIQVTEWLAALGGHGEVTSVCPGERPQEG